MSGEHPDFLWRSPEPRDAYEVVIVGGGGHGLATAYYLAKEHGITDVAVLERGWLAGGNIARNTTIIRSNYLWDESARDLRALAEAVGGARGGARLRPALQPARRAQPRAHAAGRPRRRAAGRARTGSTGSTPNGSSRTRSASSARSSTSRPTSRYPVLGATYQPRGGIARHENVAWGYARAADALGVDLVQGCEVTGIEVRDGRAVAVETTPRPDRRRTRSRSSPPGHSSLLAGDGRRAPAGAEPPAAGARLGAVRAGARHGRDVERGARLRQPGAQGRARDGRRHRRLQLVRAARLVPRDRAPARGRARAVPDLRAARACCARGPASSTSAPTRRRSSGRRRSTGSTSTAAGAPAGSRRRPARAGRSPTRSRTASRTRSNAPFPLDRFTTGALIDEHGAAGVAH